MHNPLGSLARLPRGFFCILQLFYSSHGFFACNSGPLKVHFFHVIQAKHTKPSPESAATVNGYGILCMKNPVRDRSFDKFCRQMAHDDFCPVTLMVDEKIVGPNGSWPI